VAEPVIVAVPLNGNATVNVIGGDGHGGVPVHVHGHDHGSDHVHGHDDVDGGGVVGAGCGQ